VDLEALAGEFDIDPLSSDAAQMMDIDESKDLDVNIRLGDSLAVGVEERSDDLFDTAFDDLNPEELDSLDASSNVPMATASPMIPTTEEDESFFEDGFDDLMDLDLETTQLEVRNSANNSNPRNP
jgi:hypothetical protein